MVRELVQYFWMTWGAPELKIICGTVLIWDGMSITVAIGRMQVWIVSKN
jgi:hypothetical protein